MKCRRCRDTRRTLEMTRLGQLAEAISARGNHLHYYKIRGWRQRFSGWQAPEGFYGDDDDE